MGRTIDSNVLSALADRDCSRKVASRRASLVETSQGKFRRGYNDQQAQAHLPKEVQRTPEFSALPRTHVVKLQDSRAQPAQAYLLKEMQCASEFSTPPRAHVNKLQGLRAQEGTMLHDTLKTWINKMYCTARNALTDPARRESICGAQRCVTPSAVNFLALRPRKCSEL